MLAFTSGCRPWAGQAGRARAARGTPVRPGPRSPPRRTGTAPPARCPWPPHRAAAGPPRRGPVWQGGAAQLGQGTSVQGSRDTGRLSTGHQTCLGLAASPGAPAALEKTRSFGTAGKARLGERRGSLLSPAWPSPEGPVPNPRAHPTEADKACWLSRHWGVCLVSMCSLTSRPTLCWAPQGPRLPCQGEAD